MTTPTPTLDSVNADLQGFKTQVPSLEGLLTTVPITSWNGPGAAPSSVCHWSYTTPLLSADVPLTVLSVSAVFNAWSLPVSDTAYWTAALEVGSNLAGWTVVAARSTQNTGANTNGPILARTPWTFNAATGGPWQVPQGQLLAINWSPVPENAPSSPPDMRLPLLYTIRYAEA
jgi:hypothetical protein